MCHAYSICVVHLYCLGLTSSASRFPDVIFSSIQSFGCAIGTSGCHGPPSGIYSFIFLPALFWLRATSISTTIYGRNSSTESSFQVFISSVIHVVSFADFVRVSVASQPAAITTSVFSWIHNAQGYIHRRHSRFIVWKQIWTPRRLQTLPRRKKYTVDHWHHSSPHQSSEIHSLSPTCPTYWVCWRDISNLN